MTAYLLVTMKAERLDWAAEYQANVPAIMRKHGAEYLLISDVIKRHEGHGPDPDRIALMSFPSMAAVDEFLADPDYQPYHAARLAATSGEAFAFTTQSVAP